MFGPPKNQQWAWHPKDVLESPAWRLMGINARRLLDFLTIEHLNHGGCENGRLIATYDQLVEFGLTRSCIKRAIVQLQFLGLIRHQQGGRWNKQNYVSIFTITFYRDFQGRAATNDWKRIKEEDYETRKNRKHSSKI